MTATNTPATVPIVWLATEQPSDLHIQQCIRLDSFMDGRRGNIMRISGADGSVRFRVLALCAAYVDCDENGSPL